MFNDLIEVCEHIDNLDWCEGQNMDEAAEKALDWIQAIAHEALLKAKEWQKKQAKVAQGGKPLQGKGK